MQQQIKNSQARYQVATGNSEQAKSIVRQTIQVLPPHLREQYLNMRTAIAVPTSPEQQNPLYQAKDVLDLQKVKSIKQIDPQTNYLKPVAKSKLDLEYELKKEIQKAPKAKASGLTEEMILKLPRECFSDFDLLEMIPKPKLCSNLMKPDECDVLMKQRKFFMLEMERYSEELMKVMDEM